ncbi:MAG TPA: hypothetical protein VN428_01160 [Bryobacteraceae bacterium]|nr:hypothetical protein [Bryobacteraceae bacterium]
MKAGVPYVPFKTFLAAVEGFERGIPTQLDRSLWPSYSGAIRGQLLAAFRFLELIDEADCPTPPMRDFVGKRDGRKAMLRGMIEKRYGALEGADLARTSPRQLDDAMRQYGLTGVTHKKAISFLLQAAAWSGVPLSPLLQGRTRASRSTAPQRRAEPEAPKAAAGDVAHSVRLKSGGTVTVTARVDLFALDAEDRTFLFELIDRLRAYEGSSGTS